MLPVSQHVSSEKGKKSESQINFTSFVFKTMSTLAQETGQCRGGGSSVERVPGKGWAKTVGLGLVGDVSCQWELTQWDVT